jgi:pimeloyl-ACP methyl ester carboxylesterase
MDLISRQPWIKSFRASCHSLNLNWHEDELSRPSGATKILLISQKEFKGQSTIIFLHGVGDDLLFPQARLFDFLLRQGWSIVTCDIDGHGMGNRSCFNEYDPPSLLPAIIEYLKMTTKITGPFHFMGYSLGGALSSKFVSDNQSVCASLTLIATPLSVPKRVSAFREVKSIFSKNFRSAQKTFGYIGALPGFKFFRRSEYPINTIGRKSYLQTARELIDYADPKKSLKEIRLPVLCVVGTDDTFCLLSDLPPANSYIELHKIVGGTHLDSLHDQDSWERVGNFLKSHSKLGC